MVRAACLDSDSDLRPPERQEYNIFGMQSSGISLIRIIQSNTAGCFFQEGYANKSFRLR
jgi:hypothetical protein